MRISSISDSLSGGFQISQREGKNKEEVGEKEIVPYLQSERLQQAIFLN